MDEKYIQVVKKSIRDVGKGIEGGKKNEVVLSG